MKKLLSVVFAISLTASSGSAQVVGGGAGAGKGTAGLFSGGISAVTTSVIVTVATVLVGTAISQDEETSTTGTN